jgi:primosomal replication protein N
MYNLMDNNKLHLAGKVMTTPEFSHDIYDEKFFTFDLEVSRLSDNSDIIPVLISEKLLDGTVVKGVYIDLNGQLRSYNKFEEEKRRLKLFSFVRDVKVITAIEFLEIKNPNEVELIGFICKQPIYRTTPFGREITDLLIASNRAYKKSDYVPAIAWGRNAKYCNSLDIGTPVKMTGRLQSRGYVKKVDETSEEARTAYEVSITRIKEIIEGEEEPKAD